MQSPANASVPIVFVKGVGSESWSSIHYSQCIFQNFPSIFLQLPIINSRTLRNDQELNEMSYEDLVVRWLRKHRKTQKHIDQNKKSAKWKTTLARELRKQTSATNPWIAQRLNMGDPSNVSRQVNAIPNIKD